MPSDNRYSISGVLAGVLIGLITIVCFISFSSLLGAGSSNEKLQVVDVVLPSGNDPGFKVYTFKSNQQRCFIVQNGPNQIDLECL